jgi:very-short-patch-repair endonuclease
VERARQIHNNKYDYSKTEYGKNNKEKVCIICPIHGEFWQSPNRHMRGDGCPLCGGSKKLTQNEFIDRISKIYEGKYDFSESLYVNTDTKVKCFCYKHGEFWQTPHHLLKGIACEKCGRERMSKKKIEKSSKNFERGARKIHGDKYDYSKVEYSHNQHEVCIICPEHGEFWQMPVRHLSGNGCPKCNSSRLETNVRNFLKENDINFEEQKKFDWLGKQSIDFYLPEYKIGIECQGIQHFKPIEFFGGISGFIKTISRDKNKNKLCKENGIKVLYYSVEDFPGMITDINELKKAII